MNSVGIIGAGGAEMARAFLKMSRGAAHCFHIRDEAAPRINVLVAAEASPVVAAVASRLTRDDFLIVNADDKKIFEFLGATKARLITYGFNSRACITASSVTSDGVQVCIQRGFTAADGTAREPQEFPADAGADVNSQDALGAAAAWAVIKKNSREYDNI